MDLSLLKYSDGEFPLAQKGLFEHLNVVQTDNGTVILYTASRNMFISTETQPDERVLPKEHSLDSEEEIESFAVQEVGTHGFLGLSAPGCM